MHVFLHAPVVVQIIVDIRPGFVAGNPDVLRQGELGNAIDDAEIDSLGMAALQGGDLLHRHAEHLGGRGRVDVHMVTEGLAHGVVTGDMRQHPQLDLAVVRVHQHAAGLGNEHFPDLRAQIRANRDILEVRLGGGQTSRGRYQILEGGVDPPVLPDLLHQAVGVGGFQLGQHPVIHDGRNDGVLVFQFFQNLRIGGIAGFRLFHRRKPQFFKQQLSQLAGGIDVELPAGIGENQCLAVGNSPGKHVAELPQLLPVDADAPVFHAVKHPAQGEFDLPVKLVHAVLFQLPGKHRAQVPQSFGTGRRVGVLHAQPQIVGCELGDGIVRGRGVQVIGRQRRIKDALPRLYPQLVQPVHGRFAVVENQLFPGKGQLPHLGFHRRQGTDALRPGKTDAAVPRKVHGAAFHIAGHILPPGKGLDFLLRLGGVRRRAPQTVFVDQPHKFQFLEQLIQLQPVIGLNNGILRRKIDGRFRADGGKVEGKIGVLLPRFQLFPELGEG